MYKRYLEPDSDSPLTAYVTDKIKKEAKNLRVSIPQIVPSNTYAGLTEDDNNNAVIQEERRENEDSDKSDNNFFDSISEQFIHPNLHCKTSDAIAMILGYFLEHHLSWVALEDLLDLFHELLGDESNLPKTKYFFKKCFGSKQRSVFHFYCKKCMLYIDTYENLKLIQDEKDKRNDTNFDKCTICGTEYSLKKMNDGHFFVQLPLREQLEKKIAKNVHMVDYNTRPNPTDITDIFDGDLFKSLRTKVGDVPLLTLTFNTDGVRVFKSKRKASLWPIQMFINEVSPQKRFKLENIILTGVWFGKDPNFEMYLKPLIDELKAMDEDKIKVTVNNTNNDVTVRVLLMSADSPAKCKVSKMKQYNGEFGCPYCLHPGFMVGTSTTSKYTVSPEKYDLRTHASTLALMRVVALTGMEIRGVMGVSPLIGFKDYDLVRGSVIDYMHAILEGITNLQLNLWFDSKNHREKYYITPRGTEVVNQNIKCITPLKTFSIKPRLIDDKEYWKAHEFKYWLLFYGVPCLTGTLSPVYVRHFTLLSEAIYIFLQSKITPQEYIKATNNLQKFHDEFEVLYGEENMMYSVHLSSHLPKCVKDCGPLWAYSNFNFESNNGSLIKHINGTTDVEQQIVSKYSFNNDLSDLKNKSEATFNYIERMKSLRVKKSNKIGPITLFGSAHKHKVSLAENAVLATGSEYVMAHYKFFHGNDVYYSTTYKRALQTNDTVVLLRDGRIGQINLIFDEQETVFILLTIWQTELVVDFPKHIKKICKSIVEEFIKVPAEEVSRKLLLISTSKETYLSELPNPFEGD